MDLRDATAVYRVTRGATDASNDNVPRGYKRTEVGVIPEDWEVSAIGALGRFSKGRGIRRDQAASGSVPCIRYGEIYTHHNDIVRQFNSYVSEEVAASSVLLNPGDILFAASGETKEEIGKAVAYLGPGRVYAGSDILILSPRKGDSKFLGYALNVPVVSRQKAARGQGDAVVHITANGLLDVKVPLPKSDTEQKAIVEALSDTDALIESLQQLIAKKRAIKQGAMQALLTGRQRLPGYTSEWQTKRLDQLADIRSGGTPSTNQGAFWDGDIHWCTPTDITALDGRKYLDTTSRRITQLGLKSSSAELIPPSSVVMTSRATIGECAINRIPVSTNQGFKNFVPFAGVDVEFLYYLLLTQTPSFVNLCGGSTFLEIGKTQLSAYEVVLPATETEQTAIATVLSDMDAEIEALEARLAKIRALKQGMMQQLLTGRIRLV